MVNNIDEIHQFKEFFENTIELNKNNELPYLDVLINNENNVDFKIEVYRKSTNNGLVMIGKSGIYIYITPL